MKVEGDVNTREKSLVKCLDVIGGQDCRIVFEVTQETSYHRISLQVMQASLLQEDICLIDENNSLPCSGKFCLLIGRDCDSMTNVVTKVTLKFFLKFSGLRAWVASSDLERPLDVFTSGL